MRTLKEIRSLYELAKDEKKKDETTTPGLQIKSADEKRFADKHVIKKIADRNGNGDDVFNATNVKGVDRQPKHGYNPGEDEKVYEAIDPDKQAKKGIDDILKKHEEPPGEPGEKSVPFEGPYTKAPEKQAGQKSDPMQSRARHLARQAIVAKEEVDLDEGDVVPFPGKKKEEKPDTKPGWMLRKDSGLANKVKDAQARAKAKKEAATQKEETEQTDEGYVSLAQQKAVWATRKDGGKGHPDNKKKMKKEEVELDEVLKPSMGVKAYIDDFIKSDDPRFKGASKKERMKRALAAFYAAKRGD